MDILIMIYIGLDYKLGGDHENYDGNRGWDMEKHNHRADCACP